MNDLSLAAALLAVDPGLGAVLRGPPGLARDMFLRAVWEGLPEGTPFRKMPCGISDDRLLGGLDLAATLAAGRPVAERGLLAACDGGIVVLAMAERLEPGVVARLSAAMDAGVVSAERDGMSCRDAAAFGVIALDEGIDEALPAALMDRLAFHCLGEGGFGLGSADAAGVTAGDPEAGGVRASGSAGSGVDQMDEAAGAGAIAAARERLGSVAGGAGDAEALVVACARLGIASLRAPLLAWRAARAAAALAGRSAVAAEDLGVAARLVLAPRATMVPGDEAPEPPPPAPDETREESAQQEQTGRLADSVLEAARAALPADLLAGLARGAAMRARDGGSGGAVRRNAQRGRTVGVRLGEPRGGARLHLLATLRAAAPWQKVRGAEVGPGAEAGRGAAAGRIAVRRSDFRLRRFHQSTRTTTIFVVDASGSAAVARLAEAKGAVELLLAECYVRRDRVALLSMRGAGAEVLLPPTSSLARAKRSLAGMPGGGGTPLAAGFVAAMVLADGVRRGGQTPVGVFMTDGRPNVALDGAHGRAVAEADAMTVARAWRASGHAALLVDMAVRPHPFARGLAEAAGARYLALPSAGSGALEAAVRGVVGG